MNCMPGALRVGCGVLYPTSGMLLARPAPALLAVAPPVLPGSPMLYPCTAAAAAAKLLLSPG